jgi:small subunit ribosomal protein S6
MKIYELNYLISPDLVEEELTAFQEKINNLIQEEKGILGEINKPSKRILAYPIKKFVQAFLCSINFQLEPEYLLNIEKKIKNDAKIIRYLILVKIPRKLSERRLRKPLKKFEPSLIKTGVSKKEKVELEAIDQKLDEILKEP